MPSTSDEKTCADCGTSSSDLLNVRRRHLCSVCFTKYVSSKVMKRMEPYKSKHQVGETPPKVLLPLSGGVSSIALLHVLDAQLKRRIQDFMRVAYDLVLVHVGLDDEDKHIETWRESVQQDFPDREFLPLLELQDVVEHDLELEQDLQNLGLYRMQGEDRAALITRLFVSTKTASAKSDLQELLFQRLVIATAKKHNCETVIWGHSDSRLAAKALADVAKGRGGSVPSATSDGPSPWSVRFIYPMRELYKTELESYVQLQPEGLSRYCLKNETSPTVPTSIRNTSIDDLLTGYITSQGEKYPSIMANVVRTSAKLQVPSAIDIQKCKLCSMPVTRDRKFRNLCYGCERMRQEIKI